MAQQPLFFEPDVKFEKVAAEVMLPEDPNEWPNELMQELFKQVPYIADFEPHVTMDRVDAERGFGFGHVEVQNKTAIQHGADPGALASAGVKSARIPIVIKDRKLQPLDVLVTADSKMLPLTEARLRSAIFRPQVFDVTARGPGDMSLVGQLFPPMRNLGGMGGGGTTMNVGMGKEGQPNAAATLLAAIMPSVNESDYNAFFAKVADDRGLQAAFACNAGAAAALKTLGTYEPFAAAKLASAALNSIRPSVAQLRKVHEGYSLKTASHGCWMPRTEVIDRGQALRMFGAKVVIAADQTGAVTMALGDGVDETPPQAAGEAQQNPEMKDAPELVSQFGVYKVQDAEGTELIGWVFPNLIDIDGKSLPIALFTNGSAKAVQGDIVGVPAGGGSAIPESTPQGSGCFYQTLPNGRAQALVPMTIKASMDAPGEGATVLHGETYDGTPVQVSVQPNIQEVSLVDGHLLVPDTFAWLPLDKAQDVHLVDNPEAWGVKAEAKQAMATVTLRSGGGDFSVDGFAVDKLASEQRHFLSLDEATFLLAGLGADLDYAQQKLGEAAAWGRPVPVRVGRFIKTAADVAAAAREKAASVVRIGAGAKTALRKDLLKEAAVIPDPTAVDTVLSLGFLNPENIGTFISYMPVIDDAQSKMCELLLASRLGLSDVPSGALERAVRSTEEALEGLKILAFQKQ